MCNQSYCADVFDPSPCVDDDIYLQDIVCVTDRRPLQVVSAGFPPTEAEKSATRKTRLSVYAPLRTLFTRK